jgi:hypothetical protein
MIIVLPPGAGKTHFHHLRQGIDLETLLVTCLGVPVIGHIGYMIHTTGDWGFYTDLNAGLVRALEKRYPGSIDPNGGNDTSIEILTNENDLPPEIPWSQCHLLAPAEFILEEGYRARAQINAQAFVDRSHRLIAKASSFASALVDLTRAEMDTASAAWRSGPELTQQDVTWFADQVLHDQVVLSRFGARKLREIDKRGSLFVTH